MNATGWLKKMKGRRIISDISLLLLLLPESEEECGANGLPFYYDEEN